jgi:hypothetical protein
MVDPQIYEKGAVTRVGWSIGQLLNFDRVGFPDGDGDKYE